MKIWRLVAGILCIVLSLIVTLQSCAAGVANAIEENNESSGSIGLLVAILMLSGGIVSVATRKIKGKGGSIALVILFGLAALMALTGHGSYTDLIVWGVWCLINAVMAVIAIVKFKPSPETPAEE